MAVFILYKNNGSHGTESNLGEGSEGSINGIMTLDDFQMTLVRILGISWGCVTKTIMLQAWMSPVAKVLNSELPHLVNEIQTQLLWLKPISTPEWLELCCSWMYFCQMTWDIYSRCILRCFRTVNGIIKAKGVCRMTFGKKERLFWVCQCIIKVLKAIIWS